MKRLKYTMIIIKAIVKAAEKEGGIEKLEMPSRRKYWHRCVKYGYLWYNDRKHSTHVVKLDE